MYRLLTRAAMTAGLFLLPFAHGAFASYPERPVKLVVSYQAGSTADLPVRILAEELAKKLGQSFVIDNRPATGGAVGAELVARSAPDGYTLLAGPTSPITLLPNLRPQNYGPESFVAISVLGESLYAFGVLPSLGIKTLPDLIALAKRKPGQLTYVGGGGPASANVLRFEVFKSLAGVDLQPVYYKGGLESMGDFMVGVVDVMNGNMILPQARSGTVTLLCFVSEERHPEFPNVPTLAELGYDTKISIWGGLLAPAGTPQPIVDALADAVGRINGDPAVQERLIKVGNLPLRWSRERVRDQMALDSKAYADWVRKLNIKLE